MEQTFMKEKPVTGLVLSMSLPMVLSMMVSSLYNIVDSFFVAKISENAMTSLSLVFPIQNLVNAVTIGFGIGINAVISFYLGAQDQSKANSAATQGILFSILHGGLLTLGCTAIMPFFLRMFTSDSETIELGLRYSRIVLGFAVIVALAMALEKIFQAEGKMAATMFCMLVGCVSNIILDPILIFGLGPAPRMGIEGAAWATGAGQSLSLVSYLVINKIKPLHVRFDMKRLPDGKMIRNKIYSVGIPAALNIALPSLLISSLNAILASFSQAYVLVLGVYYKLQTFLYLPANGIIQGIRPLISYNYGAREHKRVKNIYKVSLFMIAAIMGLGTVLCWTMPEKLIGLFTTSGETIVEGAKALKIISAGFVVSAVSVTSSGALEGLGMGMPSLVISLLRYVLVIIPAAFVLSRFAGASGIWHAFWITEAFSACASRLIYLKATRK